MMVFHLVCGASRRTLDCLREFLRESWHVCVLASTMNLQPRLTFSVPGGGGSENAWLVKLAPC